MRKLVTELRCSDRSNAHEFSCSCWYLIWSGHDFTCWWNLRLLLQQQQQQKTSSHIYYSLLHIASNPWEHFFDQAAEAATAAVIIGIYFGCLFLYCCCWFFFAHRFENLAASRSILVPFFALPGRHTTIHTQSSEAHVVPCNQLYWNGHTEFVYLCELFEWLDVNEKSVHTCDMTCTILFTAWECQLLALMRWIGVIHFNHFAMFTHCTHYMPCTVDMWLLNRAQSQLHPATMAMKTPSHDTWITSFAPR